MFGNYLPKRSVRYTTLYYEVLRILSGNQGLWAFPRWWYIKIYMIWKTIWFSIRRYPLSIRTVSVSCVKAHNVMLGIPILQKHLLFKYKNLSINGINTHRKVIYSGMLTKDMSMAFELCTIQILISIYSGVIVKTICREYYTSQRHHYISIGKSRIMGLSLEAGIKYIHHSKDNIISYTWISIINFSCFCDA